VLVLYHVWRSQSTEQLQRVRVYRVTALLHAGMCIALVTTAHPDYPLILIDNRDVGRCFISLHTP